MKVKDVMHSGVEWVAPDTTIFDIANLMKKGDIGAVPVGENDKLIGMITDRDIVTRAVSEERDVKEISAKDVMTKGIFYCVENEDLGDAVRIMEDHKIRRLPVINKDKRMVGMLSLGDIADAASHELSGEVISAVASHHK